MTIPLAPIIKTVVKVLTNRKILEFARKECAGVQIFWDDGLVVFLRQRENPEPQTMGENIILELSKLIPEIPLYHDEETEKPHLYLEIPKEEVKHGEEADKPETS